MLRGGFRRAPSSRRAAGGSGLVRPAIRSRPSASGRPSSSASGASKGAEDAADDGLSGRSGADLRPGTPTGSVTVAHVLDHYALDAGRGVLGHPRLRARELAGHRRQREWRAGVAEQLLEVLSTCTIGAGAQVSARKGEDVEHHEDGRRELSAAGGVHRRRVDAPLQRREVEPATAVDDELPVYLGLSSGCRLLPGSLW